MRARRRSARRPSVQGGMLLLLLVFVGFNAASAAYTLITKEYNGDFYGVPIQLTQWTVMASFVATTLPFLVLYGMSRRMLRGVSAVRISVPIRFLSFAVPVILSLQIWITYQYDVGIIGQPPYEVGGPVKPLILFLNRFQPFYLGTLFILLLPKGSRLEWLVIALVVTVGLMRAGLGAFLYIGLTLMLKYHEPLRALASRHKVTLVVAAVALPMAVAALYEYRATLREDDRLEEMSVATLVMGLFLGRMSSLSNTMIILENSDHFAAESRRLEPLYFAKQSVGGVLGGSFAPQITPQYLLINIHGTDIENYSFMTGLIGDFLIARHKSWSLPVFNATLVVLMVYVTLTLAKTLGTPVAVPFAFMLMLYPMMSGVAGELAGVAYFFALLAVLFGTVNLFRRPRRRRPVARSAVLLANPQPMEPT